MKATDAEQRQFLLTCAAWQDALLQGYRSLHVTMQGFLVAAGAAVLAVQLTGAVQAQKEHFHANATFNLLFTVLLLFLFWLQRKTSIEFKGVVESRALDINYWHQRVILSENAFLPEQRMFTYFKMWQQAKRASVDHLLYEYLPKDGITPQGAEKLVGQGLGHTRRVLDVNLFERLQLVWQAMAVVSIGLTAWLFVLWGHSRIVAA